MASEKQTRPRGAAPEAADSSSGSSGPAPSAHRVARNTVFSAVGELSNLLLFLLGFLAARYLGPIGFGQYSAAFAFVGLFRIIPDFGMSYASALSISREPSLAAKLIGNLLGFQAVLSVLTLVLCLGIGQALFEGVTWTAVLVLSVDLVLKAVKSTLRWLLKAFELFGTEAVSLLAERILILSLGLASLVAGYGVIGFVLAFALVRLIDTSALYTYICARVVRLVPSHDRPVWWDLLRRGLPFAYAGLMITMFFQVDTVMLEQMRSDAEVGWYSAPVRVLEGLTLIPRILGYALIPTMAALFVSRPSAVTALYARGSKYLLVVGLPIAAFGAIYSDPLIPLIFGSDYGPSVGASVVLLPAAAFMFVSNFGETTLACINRWGTIVVVSTAALALNIGLNLAWIPSHGFHGAAWATLLTEGAYFVMTAAALAAYGHRIGWARTALRPIVATGAFAAVLWAMSAMSLLVASLCASVVFVLATIALGVWDERERELFLGLLRGARPDAGRLTSDG